MKPIELENLNMNKVNEETFPCTFQFMSKLTDHAKQCVVEIMSKTSNVEKLREIGECLYANKATLNNELRTCVAKSFRVMMNHGFTKDLNRAQAIIDAMQRDCKVKGTWPKEADDPKPLAQYLPSVENEEIPGFDEVEATEQVLLN